MTFGGTTVAEEGEGRKGVKEGRGGEECDTNNSPDLLMSVGQITHLT